MWTLKITPQFNMQEELLLMVSTIIHTKTIILVLINKNDLNNNDRVSIQAIRINWSFLEDTWNKKERLRTFNVIASSLLHHSSIYSLLIIYFCFLSTLFTFGPFHSSSFRERSSLQRAENINVWRSKVQRQEQRWGNVRRRQKWTEKKERRRRLQRINEKE